MLVNCDGGVVDVVMTFEEKVFDSVLEDLNNREQPFMKTILVMNLEVKDNHEEAAIGGRLALELCQEVSDTNSNGKVTLVFVMDFRLKGMNDGKIQSMTLSLGFEKQHRRKLVYSISFYRRCSSHHQFKGET
ncbi:unnamed protein product [Eruca vesicaria subsp. sativa]|uniref:RNA polymerase II subunit A C-terminal domain phosphatase SSU72 n=1 Tax=Eruca vesicaria subsp. sativa TaxID=29727 RepID=A0ABC8KJK2_ERUVS|nr:unnamed protein product [Eruca vesicaria subsp. sativa]